MPSGRPGSAGLFRNPCKTAAVSSAPREKQRIPSVVSGHASAPFALLILPAVDIAELNRDRPVR